MTKNGVTKRILALLLTAILTFQGVGEFMIPQVLAEQMQEEVKEIEEAPEETEAPKETEEEEEAEEPGETETPEETKEPEETEKTGETEEPEETEKPGETEEPGKTETPEATEKPEETKDPESAETQENATEDQGAAVSEADADDQTESKGEPTEYFLDTEEIGLRIVDNSFQAKNGQNQQLTVNQTGNLYDLSANAFYDIKDISFALEFTVKKNDESRKLKKGDTLTVEIPKVLAMAQDTTNRTISMGEIVIGTYEIVDNHLVITFTETVDFQREGGGYLDIKGGLELNLNVDQEAMKDHDKRFNLIDQRGEDEPAIEIQFPELSETISGIQKWGQVNQKDQTIEWTIRVGTDQSCQGASLSGITLEETFGEDQTFVSASANGRVITLDEKGNLPLAGLELTAPAEIKVVTAVKKEVLEELWENDGSKVVKNTVTMKADQSTSVDEVNATATAQVTVSAKAGIQKSGVQIDSHTIRWTIQVNQNPKVTAYHATVIDQLPEGLRYQQGTLRYQIDYGNQTECQTEKTGKPGALTATETWKDHVLYVYTDQQTNVQTLYFRLQEITSSGYTLIFDTTVDNGYEPEKVENKAFVECQIPYYTGEGIEYTDPKKYGTPGIGVDFYRAKLNKSVQVDKEKADGQLTWTLEPSTRIEENAYDTAVITDEIDTEHQKYCEGSLKIYHKNEDQTEKLKSKGYFEWTYQDDTHTLTITFHQKKIVATSGYSEDLRDYRIVYQTTALDYLHTNHQWHNYTNKATLQIFKNQEKLAEDSAWANASLGSNWINKNTRFEYDADGKPYFHYTIDVNNDFVKDLTNVSIVDDITEAIRFVDPEDQERQVSTDWVIDDTRTRIQKANGEEATTARKTISADGKRFECTFDTLSEKITIHLYVTYQGSKEALSRGIYQNRQLYSYNTAGVKSDEIGDAVTSDYLVAISDSKGNEIFDNTLVKKGNGAIINQDGTKINWEVTINPNSGAMGELTISDSIKKSQKYIQDSVKLYQAKFTEGSKYIQKGDEVKVKSISFDVDEEYRTMKIMVDANNGPLILEYQTGVVMSVQLAQNDVLVADTSWEYGKAQGNAWLSGNNWGTLRSVGNFTISKYDTSLDTKQSLAGAQITVYSDPAGTQKVDVGVTDAEGKVTFSGLEVGLQSSEQKYYYRETAAPKGYVTDGELHEVTVYRGKTVEMELENIRISLDAHNEPSKVSVQKLFYYTDGEQERVQASGQQAQFELIFYPHGKDRADAKKVSLSGEEGHYRYEQNAENVTATLVNAAEDGKLMIEGLPWGSYGIRELATAEGFVLDQEECFFEIAEDMTVTYHFGTNAKKDDAVIENESTTLYVVKYDKEKEEIIEDILFKITDEDGNPAKDRLDEDKPYEWTSTDEKERIDHLPEGTYELWEGNKEEPDLEFTVEPDGTITVDGETLEDSTIKIIDDSVPVEVTKYRDWVEKEERPAIDESEYELFAGVKFTLQGKLLSGEDEREYVTDEDGVFTLRYLLIDGETYTLIEDTPVGYQDLEIDTTFIYYAKTGIELIEHDEENVSGEEGQLDILNVSRKEAALQLILYNAKTKEGVPDVGFELDGSTTGKTELVSADEGDKTTYETPGENKEHELTQGEVFAPNLPAGDYTLEQTTVPDGYEKVDEMLKISFTISEDETNSLIKIDEDAIKSGKYGIKVISGNPDALFRMEPADEAPKEQQKETAVTAPSKERAVQLQQNEIVAQTLGQKVLPKTSREDLTFYWMGGSILILLGVGFYMEDKKKRHC